MPKAETSLLIEAPPEKVLETIVDYERYPEFLPEMRTVTILSRADGLARVRFEIEIMMRLSYVLRLVEDPPYQVSWTLEEAKMMSINSGGWLLEPVAGGQTKASYGLEVKLRGLMPKSVTTRLLGTTLPKTLERFKARIEGVPNRSA